MGIKQEPERLKRSSGEKAVSVNDIVSSLESCKISSNSSKDSNLNELLKNLKIDDNKVQEKPCERKAQPKEDDERGVVGLICDLNAIPDNLVKLEAPNVDDKEEDDEEESNPLNEEAESVLEERGPMLGVAANYNVEGGYNHIASKPCTPYQNVYAENSCHFAVQPCNFLENGNQNTTGSRQGKGNKREMDVGERYYEPLKYNRPHNAGMENINNLSNPPCYPANSTVGNTNGKAVAHVIQKQMSGSTMYTPDDNPPQNDLFLDGGLNSQELNELFNIPVDTDDSLPVYQPPSPNVIFEQSLGDRMVSEIGVEYQPPWTMPVGSSGQMVQSSDTYGPCYPPQPFEDYQQTAFQNYQNGGQRKRGSFGNDDGSDGYGSDLSPSHDHQMSPASSPRSMTGSSPATMNGSPPRTNWSPPPSNMSCSSADSGVGSPMTDELNGYSSQKSPRQIHVMSPKSVSSVTGTPYQSRTSPTITPLTSLPSSKHYQITTAETDIHRSEYVSTHLPDLDIALEIASEDLMSERLRKGYPQTSLQITPGLSGGNSAVNNTMNYNETVHMPSQFYQIGRNTTAAYVVTNNVMNGKTQQSIPNLPTTVPSTIQIGNKNIINGQQITSRFNQSDFVKNINGCQPVSNGNYQPINFGNIQPVSSGNMRPMVGTANQPTMFRNTVQVTQPAGPGPFIRAPTSTSNFQPPVNSQGKIPIEPINQKPKVPGQSPVFLMKNDGTVTPVFIVPQTILAKTPPRAQRKLLPKDPAKQNEKTVDVITKPASGGNSPTNCCNSNQGDKSPSAPVPNGKKAGGSSVEKLLNLARRLVAEMSTADLRYRDEDGDTYLHVAVCKADKFMVQALLERLVREGLTEMIDKQNLQGQTPLYLAVSTNNAEMVQLLIEQGADVNPFAESETSTGSIEKTAAIHCASTKGEKHLGTLLALLKAPEININQVNSEGHTALNCAILAHGRRNTDQTLVNSIPIIRALLQAHADPNLQVQQSGKTALMYALESRDLDLIESTFQLVEPQKLPTFLKTQAFDSSTCMRIVESFKTTLDPAGVQRLQNCLKSGSNRGIWCNGITTSVGLMSKQDIHI